MKHEKAVLRRVRITAPRALLAALSAADVRPDNVHRKGREERKKRKGGGL